MHMENGLASLKLMMQQSVYGGDNEGQILKAFLAAEYDHQ